MTNLLVGLMVLSINVTTNMATNAVGITCEEAGCTNWVWGEIQVQDQPGVTDPRCGRMWDAKTDKLSAVHMSNCSCKPATWRAEKTKMCKVFHTRPVVYPVCVVETIVMGTTNVPLFEIVTQTLASDSDRPKGLRFIDSTWHQVGTFIRRVGK